MYSKKDLEEIDKRLKMVSENAREESRVFWDQNYPKKSNIEKAKYWASSLHRSMRSQEETGNNAYNIYTEQWMIGVLEVESNFLDLLPMIINIWSGVWDSYRIEKRIRKLYKKLKIQ